MKDRCESEPVSILLIYTKIVNVELTKRLSNRVFQHLVLVYAKQACVCALFCHPIIAD